MNEPPPNPGSKEAGELGCTCPILDNSHGKGYMGIQDVFVYNGNCPVHKPEIKKEESK